MNDDESCNDSGVITDDEDYKEFSGLLTDD